LLTLRTLIDGMIETLVEQEGLDLDAMPQIVGSKYEITIMPRKQN
jgi:antitoxin component HigA of HigAB toxin-antitoxin module